MKVLFVGLGSIGKRNLKACQAVRPQYTYAALRSGHSPMNDQIEGVTQFHDVQKALQFKADIIWICNSTHLHAESVTRLAQKGTSFFIEKPLAHLPEDLAQIERLILAGHSRFFYGCVMRQHPVIKKVRQILESRQLGRPLSYQLNCGSYLPDWRPGADYRTIYSARHEQGGGVALDLIHEFDYAEWWFGELTGIDGFCGRVSDLELDSNDLCLAGTVHRSGVRGQIELNYFRTVSRRNFEICLTEGLIEGDLLTARLRWQKRGATEQVQEFPHERDALYRSQSEEIFASLEGSTEGGWEIEGVARLNRKVVEWADQARSGRVAK